MHKSANIKEGQRAKLCTKTAEVVNKVWGKRSLDNLRENKLLLREVNSIKKGTKQMCHLIKERNGDLMQEKQSRNRREKKFQ